MKVWMLWHGGSSYSPANQFNRDDCEPFDSLKDAINAFRVRGNDSSFPCVDESEPEDGGPSAWICFSDPYRVGDLYPDRVLSFGPRGGVKVEHG